MGTSAAEARDGGAEACAGVGPHPGMTSVAFESARSLLLTVLETRVGRLTGVGPYPVRNDGVDKGGEVDGVAKVPRELHALLHGARHDRRRRRRKRVLEEPAPVLLVSPIIQVHRSSEGMIELPRLASPPLEESVTWPSLCEDRCTGIANCCKYDATLMTITGAALGALQTGINATASSTNALVRAARKR